MLDFKSTGSVYDILEPHVHPTDVGQPYLKYEDYYGLYLDISRKVKPKVIVEIGVRFGYSAIVMLSGVDGDCSYFGFDNQSYGEVNPNEYAAKEINKVCKRRSEIVLLDTQTVTELPGLEGIKADLIHVDGAHYAKGVRHDLDLVAKYTHPDTYIIVDDTNHKGMEDAGEAAHAWANEHGYDWRLFIENCGRTVMRKK